MKMNTEFNWLHVVAAVTLIFGTLSTLRAEVGRIDKLEVKQKYVKDSVANISETLTKITERLEDVYSDVNYLRGLNDLQARIKEN